MLHSNVGGAQGMSHFEESYVTDYTLLMVGAGLQLSERVILDLSYYNPSKRVYGAFRFSPPEGDGLLHERTIRGMRKMGLCFFF